MRIPRLSIGARWTLRYTGATLLMLVLLAWFVYQQIANLILGSAEAELTRQTSAVTETLSRSSDRPDLVASFIESEIAGADPALRLAVELVDEEGSPWLRRDILSPFTEPLPASLPSNPSERLLYKVSRGDAYPYFVMVVPNGRGFTLASLYGGPYLRRIEEVRRLFLFVIPIAVALTGLLGWWLARQSLRPIARITETARRITAAPGGESIPVTGSGDELDRLAATLNEMLERIRGGLVRLRRFSVDAAHQLRTPLAVLQTRVEVTLEKPRTAEEYHSVLAEMLGDIERLGDGVYSILRLADSSAGLRPGQRQPVALAALLQAIAEFFGPLAGESGIRLCVRAPEPVTVWGDSVSLHHLFANLVDNAIKYSKSGGTVVLELSSGPGLARVAVSDTGSGIEAVERERIFDHFFRGNHHQSTEGIGIGLTLAAEIARAHGGRIDVESSGCGSTFEVRLPTRSLPGE